MNRIFIEAKNSSTSEYNFLKAILSLFFSDKEFGLICMDGVSNLFNESIINQISQAQISGEQVLVFVDADTVSKGWGYRQRKDYIEKEMMIKEISFSYFLYPNNHDDGDVEILMEQAVRRDLHSIFFDCFEDYERCVSRVKDKEGNPLYNVPSLKNKLHTYMSAQKLTNQQRRKDHWLFGDERFWNLNVPQLQPLKDFLKINLR
ncbi:DUF3226 domain-containing protein [Barnesiella viscericola]|uniref:DUF3226 domain-containing protein n=1 Tax=Barnesiella viscericola TaxID=397865 RepID=UPI002353455C|nr:DUF3226 domain-containing protein [Barnesiella viscericola]